MGAVSASSVVVVAAWRMVLDEALRRVAGGCRCRWRLRRRCLSASTTSYVDDTGRVVRGAAIPADLNEKASTLLMHNNNKVHIITGSIVIGIVDRRWEASTAGGGVEAVSFPFRHISILEAFSSLGDEKKYTGINAVDSSLQPKRPFEYLVLICRCAYAWGLRLGLYADGTTTAPPALTFVSKMMAVLHLNGIQGQIGRLYIYIIYGKPL